MTTTYETNSDYEGLEGKELEAMFALEDEGFFIQPARLAEILPHLPPNHETTRFARGLLHGMTLSSPKNWRDLMGDEEYSRGYWAGWTRTHDRVLLQNRSEARPAATLISTRFVIARRRYRSR